MSLHARHKKSLEKVEQVFAQAHRLRVDIVVGPDWAQDIMREVRRGDAEQRGPSMLAWAEPLVWRVAGGAALAAVLFAGSVLVYTSQRSAPVTAFWMEELDAGAPLPEE
ncbi:MAG: hypothetical protein AABZ34_13510 [Nitrospirota bacterium]